MTSPAIQLANEILADDHAQVGAKHAILTLEELETFYARAKAQALRDAADKMEADGVAAFHRELRRMAEELEK